MQPQPKPEVQTDIRMNCGCGFKCIHMHEAVSHVLRTKHIMEVRGEISPLTNEFCYDSNAQRRDSDREAIQSAVDDLNKKFGG